MAETSRTAMVSEKPTKEKLDVQIKSADMVANLFSYVWRARAHYSQSEEMQQQAIEVSQTAFEKFSIEKDIAQYIKKEFDSRAGATWHCIVGRNFGSFVTHETKHFIYFYLGHCAILLFKTQ